MALKLRYVIPSFNCNLLSVKEMEEAFSVRFITFSNGERYPLLLNHQKKALWYATLYATTQIRNASKAPNTITAVLAAIRVLFSWALSQEQNNATELQS